MERITCWDCGGTGADSGALNEPEACPVCQGGGQLDIEMETRSSAYGQRKAVQRAGGVVAIGNGLFARTRGRV